MSRTLLTIAALLLLARCLAPAPASAADAPPADEPRQLAKLAGPCEMYVLFSGDGKRIVVAGRDEARLCDAETFRPLSDPIRQKNLNLVRFSADGRVLLTVGDDVRLWDAHTGKPLGAPIEIPPIPAEDAERADTVAVWGVGWDIAPSPCAISADGKRVAVTQVAPANPPATRWEVRVWEVEPRRVVRSLRQELRPAFVTFSPDGTRIVSAAPVDHRPHGGGEVFHLWDLATGTEALPAPSTKYNSFGPDSPPAAFSPDGSRLLVGDLTTFAVHDGRTGQLIADTSERQGAFPLGGRGPDLSALTFSANGRRVVVQNCGWFHVWDSASWAPITEWASGSDAVLSADGRRVAACYYSDESRTHYVAVRDVDTGRELIRIDTGGGSLVALSPDGRRVAAGFASDGYTAVWVVPEGKRP